MVHAMQQLKDHWNRAAQASPHHAQYAQISSMCDEYHFALTTSPNMPIVISSHDDYKAYDDPDDPTDMPSELNNDHPTVPSPTDLRKSESTHAGAITVHPHSAESINAVVTVAIKERSPRSYHVSADTIRSTWIKPAQVIKVSMETM